MSRYSIRQLCLSYSSLALTLVVLLSVLSYFIVRENIQQQAYEANISSLTTKAENISNIIEFHRELVSKIAKQKKLVDMILFFNTDDIQVWASTMQDLLPENIGLALFDSNGRVLGNPVSLRLGDKCVSDIQGFLKHKEIGNPPVHNDNQLFEHYDVVEKIYDHDEVIGVIFISFSLSSLHTEIDRITKEGQYIILGRGEGQIISQSDKHTDRNIDFNHKINIKNTDWFLDASFEKKDLSMLLIMIAIVNIFLFILVNIVLFGYSRKLFRLFSEDFKAIQALLMRVKKGSDKPEDIKLSGLSETEEIVNNIQYLADDISQLIDFSTTDELTGIYNRRAFNKEIIRYIQFAHRDVHVSLVVMDVDYFKRVNDKHGHLVGDKVLQILGDTLTEITRETDICARLGGDEFAAILVSNQHEEIVTWYKRLAEQFRRQQLKQITEMSGENDACSLSAGFTTILISDTKMESILSRADDALYAAKSAGRGSIQAYDNQHKNVTE
jgi:diguanylate cyclase (GGDEF)-like protein